MCFCSEMTSPFELTSQPDDQSLTTTGARAERNLSPFAWELGNRRRRYQLAALPRQQDLAVEQGVGHHDALDLIGALVDLVIFHLAGADLTVYRENSR